ncbi:MAG TPA: ASCH domain-containing protein [Candidatus Nitrosopelagicus sp.]|jgi:predicted transcriptional regulator|nr:ASCH domain-containing protein [Candidatus Nitrosopelagicus sp.]|tara:strand:- start:2524 stop:2973 length:450 start_codon:yes stop_codon:yes gene_type:complete
MKCLSVCQPFADLIIQGKKTIELRKWNTKFRGEFLVQAAQNIRTEDCRRLKMKDSLTTGAIIGKVELVSVKKYENESKLKLDSKKHLALNNKSDSKYGFILQNPKQFKVPIPCKGKLKFFEVEANLPNTNEIKIDLFEEEHRYMWINHH